jgi:nucleotide-binding universal stress UspA family protein
MSTGPLSVPAAVRGPDPGLHRILCPIDFSPASPLAVAEAVALARAARGEITILFVLPCAPPSRGDPPPVPEGVTSAVAEDVEALVRPARAVGIPVRVCLKAGDPAHEILQTIDRTIPDLVVMGTHGRGGLRRLTLGSVASEVLRSARCPVLTVAGREGHGTAPAAAARDGIVCAVSLSGSSSRTIALACAVARATSAHLTFQHVLADHDPVEARAAAAKLHAAGTLAAAFGLGGARTEEVVVAGNPVREILRLAAARSARMVVIGGSRLAPGARPRSITERLVRGAGCAVLTVRGAP